MQSSNDDLEMVLNDPEFKRKQAEALKTIDDFPSVLEYRQHISRFASDFSRAIMQSADFDKARDIAVEIENVLENNNISNSVFAIAAIVENIANSFEDHSSATIIYAGFMKIVTEFHEEHLKLKEAKENDNGK
jgi:hypothetical protein